jgi:chemotaxis protein methyltransferase CheR
MRRVPDALFFHFGLSRRLGIVLSSRAALRFQHIVFAERAAGRGAAVNLAPSAEFESLFDSQCDDPIFEESRDDDLLLRWLLRRGGLDASKYRPETLRRRVPACLRAIRANSPMHARKLIARNRSLLHVAINALVIGVTSLFRDPAVFNMLGERALPELADGRDELRIWSAGCSHGAEAYSIAMLVAEMGLLNSTYLLGTDCRSEATARAATGAFDATEVRTVPMPMIQKYFYAEGHGFVAKPWLRQALHWRTADLLSVHEPGSWDMILCRNVAMYINGESAAALWERFENSLRPGGVLVLGKAERPLGAEKLSLVSPCIYRRNRG